MKTIITHTHTHTHTQQLSCQVNFSTKILKNAFVFAFFLLTFLFGTSPLFAQTAQELPHIAVYVTGGKTADENSMFAGQITHALVNSGRFLTIERADVFIEQVEHEHATQRSGAIDDRQISRLGQQAGAQFVCIVQIVEAFGGHQISARIVNVETVAITHSGIALGELRNINDFRTLSQEVVTTLLGTSNVNQQTQQRQQQISTPPLATPAANRYTLTINMLPNFGGTVNVNPNLQMYDAGTRVNIVAVPAPGFRFVEWDGGLFTQEENINLMMNRNLTINANFEPSDSRSASSSRNQTAATGKWRDRRPVDHFFAPKWILPITDYTKGFAFDLEYGQIRENRWRSIDIGFGYSDNSTLGLTANLGAIRELSNMNNISYGASFGCWWANHRAREYYWWGESSEERDIFAFAGPIIRLRVQYFEITYRGLIGWESDYDADWGLGYLHQLMIGLHFSTNRRGR